MPVDPLYDKFIKETGLSISRATFYRIRQDMRKGSQGRLTRVIEQNLVPKQVRKERAYKKHADPDTVPFIAYDGEGITLEGKHRYVLLACSNRESIYRPNGLSTVECLDFLLRTSGLRRIRVFFAFGYDVQQMLVDVPDADILRLMHGELIRYKNYRISYLPGKIFSVNNVKFYDVFPFYQTSFIKAVTESLGKDAVSEDLVKGKESRSDFASWRIDDITRYTNEELDLLVQLVDHLRSILLRAGIHLGSAFYGPGSIANYWFKAHGISPPKITDPTLLDVMERAYYGGRFESFSLGRVDEIWECDINSAYPSIISNLPYLDEWEWYPPHNFSESEFSVWKVQWRIPSNSKIGPFPSRDKNGLISYPANGIGWYWKPEIEAALKLYPNGIQILGGYIPKVIEGRPFEWVEEIYNRRLELKNANDPAQWALKVGLNSLYGKTAQRVGSAKYFSLAWAGYITAATRAKLLTATIGKSDHVIAFATDAVYFDIQPNLVASSKLGGWSVKEWTRGFFIQSGVYRLENEGGHKDAYRGFSVKNGIQDLLDQIRERPFNHPALYQLKFVSHLEAIRAPKTLGPYRLCFITVRKKLQPFKTTKRKVLDRRVWLFVEDQDWIGPNKNEEVITYYGKDFVSVPHGRNEVFAVWNNYGPLLTSRVDSEILVNHNDHADVLHDDIGELEESYPFARITERKVDMALSDTDEVASERLGGSSGLVSISKISRLPIVDETDILKELEH